MKRISVKECAQMLGCSEQMVRELVKRGHFGTILKHDNRKTYLIYDELVRKEMGWSEQ